MNPPSYVPDYYSLDDIAVTQERIPCRSLASMYKLGFLDTAGESETLAENVNLELPLWYLLQQDERNRTFDVQLPSVYNAAYKEIYKADASAVELGSLNKFYYQLGIYLARYDTGGTMVEMLYDTARERLKTIKDMCNNVSGENFTEGKKLEHLERLMYENGCRRSRIFHDWLQEKQVNIKSTEIAVNIRKRKREVMEEDDDLSQVS